MKPARFTISLFACLVVAAVAYRSDHQAPPYLRDALKDLRLEDISIGDTLKLETPASSTALPGKVVGGHPFHCIGQTSIIEIGILTFVVIGNFEDTKGSGHVLIWKRPWHGKGEKFQTNPNELRGALRLKSSDPDQGFDRIGTLYNTNPIKHFDSWDILSAPSWRHKNEGEAYPASMEFTAEGKKIEAPSFCFNGTPSDRYPGSSKEIAESQIMGEADDFQLKFKKYWRESTLLANPTLDRVYQEEDILTPQELTQSRAPLYRGTNSPPNVKFLEGFKPRFSENFQPNKEHARSLADVLDTLDSSDTSERTRWISFSKSSITAALFGNYIYEVYKPGGVDLTEIYKRYIPKILHRTKTLDRCPTLKEVAFSRHIEPRYIRGAYVTHDAGEGKVGIGRFIPNPSFAP